tara:strand:- start:2949 stop:4190 length:1242 start_codon:yes stop_codon:yes gene_type:complete
MTKIGIIGLGFVGLTTATGLAHLGHKVYCFERDKQKSDNIKHLDIPFHEPYLDKNLKKYLNKNLFILNNVNNVICEVDIIFVCVGTPSKSNGKADLRFIKNFFNSIIKNKPRSKKIVCIKSTVPPGSCQTLDNYIKTKIPRKNISIAFVPEFLREGFAWKDFIYPDRIVIGSSDETTFQTLSSIFSKFKSQIIKTNLVEAEFIKYLSNNLLSTLISFSNEMSMIARNIGDINLKNVFETLHLDKRWTGQPAKMSSYVFPGAGYGGYCLPKDLKAMINIAKDYKYKSKLLVSVDQINTDIKNYNLTRIKKSIKNENEKIGIIGVSFKKGSDDIRESPSFFYINELIKTYKNISIFDELAIDNFKEKHNHIKVNAYKKISQLIKNSKTIIILLDQVALKKAKFNNKNIIDLRYIL